MQVNAWNQGSRWRLPSRFCQSAEPGPSPYLHPRENVRIRVGAPKRVHPSAEQRRGLLATLPRQAEESLDRMEFHQAPLLKKTEELRYFEGRHVLLCGGTSGYGLALECYLRKLVGPTGSLTNVSKDPSPSLAESVANEMEIRAMRAEIGDRYAMLRNGVGLDEHLIGEIRDALIQAEAHDLIYIYTVGSGVSGVREGFPEIFTPDVDPYDGDLIQWKSEVLDQEDVDDAVYHMGKVAVELPKLLEKEGFSIAEQHFTDWHGSLDVESQDPNHYAYGRRGPYSTLHHLAKQIIHAHVHAAQAEGRKGVMNHFLPLRKTRAARRFPGGIVAANLYEKLQGAPNRQPPGLSELSLSLLKSAAIAGTTKGITDPFVRHDRYETEVDPKFLEIMENLSLDSNHPYYFGKWLQQDQPFFE